MLTQGPVPDPKCKFNISLFLTVPHLLDCLICNRNYVSIVLLLSMMGEWDRCGLVDSYLGVVGGQGVGIISQCFFICVFVFCSLMSCLFFK